MIITGSAAADAAPKYQIFSTLALALVYGNAITLPDAPADVTDIWATPLELKNGTFAVRSKDSTGVAITNSDVKEPAIQM